MSTAMTRGGEAQSAYPTSASVRPDDVLDTLGKHILVDGFHLVLDLDKSHGSRMVDAATGQEYLDFYTMFASLPIGHNHPGIAGDPAFVDYLGAVARSKPANSDIYTTAYAQFVETFARVLGDPQLPHLFFVEGGGLAVENALKTAFDWKSRRNEAAGRSPDLGTRVMHLTGAFHGRTGYTMSLTNTDPGKVARFPKFDWPRISSPGVIHPLDQHRDDVEAAERRALAQARAAFEAHPHDIACFICEPIQGEGGDVHLREEFLLAMQGLCHEYDALFVLDEVQTGLGTGTPWAYQQLGLEPDIVAFAKKVQLGGIMAGRRVDDVADNVFAVSGRINSTWGGGLIDMVRSTRILEIIEHDRLFEASAFTGQQLLTGLQRLENDIAQVSNARGRGLMCAFDVPDGAARGALLESLREHGVIALPCGERSVRFRPALTVSAEEIDAGLAAIRSALTH
ncbi:L-lysine 6-transaminase precursor [Antricoccus suffuscus]|uniref:L-lysine-epsilon aminotransferase n=1 Tax=Antricoccus suffuscus TaxID=1629062 RepID=A0A2T0ZXR3_9ACTN|nr:L-lysine 6-transaminase [Antricoccus suffuscus]PRZ41146.1 L-lysine 6-transaminase precursor [Antricoccus suffuscus]